MDKILHQNQNKHKTTLEEFFPCHLRTDSFLMIFCRTELIVGTFKANVCGESFGEDHFYVAPQTPSINAEQRAFETDKICAQHFCWCRKFGDSLKRVLVKFQANPSLVRGGKRLFKVSKPNWNWRKRFCLQYFFQALGVLKATMI